MNSLFKGLLIIIALLGVSFIGFNIWTENKHDMTAVEYIQEQLDEDKPTTEADEVIDNAESV